MARMVHFQLCQVHRPTKFRTDIHQKELQTKDNPLYTEINCETENIFKFLKESINNFHLLFEKEK